MQKNMNSLIEKDETFSPADEVLPFKRPENDFFSVELFIVKTQKYLLQIFMSSNICEGCEIIKLQKMGAVEVFRLKFLTDPFTLG